MIKVGIIYLFSKLHGSNRRIITKVHKSSGHTGSKLATSMSPENAGPVRAKNPRRLSVEATGV